MVSAASARPPARDPHPRTYDDGDHGRRNLGRESRTTGIDRPDTATDAARLAAVAPMVRAITAGRWPGPAAEDAAQNALEATWRAQRLKGDLVDEGAVARYAASVARVVTPYRGKVSATATPVERFPDSAVADQAAGPAEQLDRADAVAQAQAKVAGLLAALPPRQREVMLVSRYGERDTEQVAAELGLTPSGVRTAQARAMAAMRTELGVASPNPLASTLSRTDRERAARQRRGTTMPDGAVAERATEAARSWAAERGRLPSRSELVAASGVSGGTAARVIRALHAEDGTDPRAAPPSPLRDRAQTVAREYRDQHGSLPTCRALAVEVGTSAATAADALHRVRATDEQDQDQDRDGDGGSSADAAEPAAADDQPSTEHDGSADQSTAPRETADRRRAEATDDAEVVEHAGRVPGPYELRARVAGARVAAGRAAAENAAAEAEQEERRQELTRWHHHDHGSGHGADHRAGYVVDDSDDLGRGGDPTEGGWDR